MNTNTNTQQTIALLNEVYQECQTNVESMKTLINKVKDPMLKGEFTRIRNAHEQLSMEAAGQLTQYGAEAVDLSGAEKATLWSCLQAQSMISGCRRIAEIVVDGSIAGLKCMMKSVNDNPMAEQAAKDSAEHFIQFQQNHVNQLRGYL